MRSMRYRLPMAYDDEPWVQVQHRYCPLRTRQETIPAMHALLYLLTRTPRSTDEPDGVKVLRSVAPILRALHDAQARRLIDEAAAVE